MVTFDINLGRRGSISDQGRTLGRYQFQDNQSSYVEYCKHTKKIPLRYATECNGVLAAPLLSMKLYSKHELHTFAVMMQSIIRS